mgnify:CR=1 FL=1
MVKLKIRHGIGGGSAIMPAGLILGVAPGVLPPAEWSVWSAADNFFLKGTDSDALINTTVGRTSISTLLSSGNSNHGGSSYPIVNTGDGGTRNVRPQSKDDSEGSHQHGTTIGYKPAACILKLVQAQNDAPLFEGAVFFSAVEKPEHQYYTDNLGFLAAGSNTETQPESRSASVNSGGNSHNHISSSDSRNTSISANYYTGLSSSGGTHSHSYTPAITENIKHALMRVYQAVDLSAVDDIIGMWNQAGVPDGWEVVAELVDGFLKFSNDASGDGTVSGDNTIGIVGSTNNSSHSHSPSGGPSGDTTFGEVSFAGHGSRNHNHNINTSRAYEPEHYYVKFIRKLP